MAVQTQPSRNLSKPGSTLNYKLKIHTSILCNNYHNSEPERSDLNNNSKFYLYAPTRGQNQQLRDLALANYSLPEGYQSKEIFERSPTQPLTSKTVAGNDGNHQIKSTVTSTRIRETEVDNRENFTKYGIWIITEKTVHRYVAINEKVGAEEVVDAPKVKKAPKKKAASKKRTADVVATEPVAKKKRATKKKSGLENVPVAQEAVPIQIIEPIPAAPAEEPIVEESREATSAVPIDEDISAEEQSAVEVAAATGVQEPAIEHVDEQVAETTADEERDIKDVEMIDEPVSLPVEAAVVNKDVYTADDVDVIIEQVLAETIYIEADEEEQDVDTSDVGDKTAETIDGDKHWFDLSYEAIMAQMDAERPVVTPSDTDEEMESIDIGTDVRPDFDVRLIVELIGF
ncbi:hypothetical protein F511_18442 [Dorcoceras hygrometricum]|uniref:Uncharacterized protein n=1 Tax=Dorcoceras hygrometricum TaxID=472368 RepID=A0A2Z7B9U8_9LAMI|nr:hypothetical protein F511_18442 [Dorcoceras hygrometricum]